MEYRERSLKIPEGLFRATPGADVRLPVVVLSLLAVLQALLLLVAGGGLTRIIAVCLAVAGIYVRLPTLVVFAVLIVINFGAHLNGLAPPFPYRLAHVSILAMYGAVALAALASTVPRVRFAPALAVAGSLALALIAAEGLVERLAPPAVLGLTQVRWVGGPQPDPVLGDVYSPYAMLRTEYPDNPRGYFDVSRPSSQMPSSPAEYSVTYSLNALGCRGRDYPIPRPPERGRLLVLGNSDALGVGVREADTFAARLEQSLNADPEAAVQGYDVINCGANGYATRQQRLFYEQIAYRYEPDVVLVSMTEHDNLSRRDELRLGYAHEGGRIESLLLSARLFQYARHEGRRNFDYSGALEDLSLLRDACRSRGARLAVILFGNPERSPHWNDFATDVSTKLQGMDVPVLDLGLPLLKDHHAGDLVVHPLDANPNETAHRVAAEEIERFLRRQGLVR